MKNEKQSAKTVKIEPKQKPPAPPFQQDLRNALEWMFTEGGWEIPDQAIEGKLTAKVLQLEAQVKSLTNRMAELVAGSSKGEAPKPIGRVDVASVVKGKRKKK
jgi:hypothetical protein